MECKSFIVKLHLVFVTAQKNLVISCLSGSDTKSQFFFGVTKTIINDSVFKFKSVPKAPKRVEALSYQQLHEKWFSVFLPDVLKCYITIWCTCSIVARHVQICDMTTQGVVQEKVGVWGQGVTDQTQLQIKTFLVGKFIFDEFWIARQFKNRDP